MQSRGLSHKMSSLVGINNEEEEVLSKRQWGTAWTSIFTLSNACIGAGVLAFPHVFCRGGLIFTLFLMLIVAALEGLSLEILARNSRNLGVVHYQALVHTMYGDVASIFLSIVIALYMFGALSAYFIIIGDTFSALATRHLGKESICSSYRFDILVIGICIILPLSLKRNFHALRHVSIISVASLVYLLIAIFIRSMQSLQSNDWRIPKEVKYFPENFSAVMDALPVIAFAFVCHLQVCEVAAELGDQVSLRFWKNNSHKNEEQSTLDKSSVDESTGLITSHFGVRKTKAMTRIIIVSLIVCAVGYVSIGAMAYLGDPVVWETTDDLLEGYSYTDNLMEIGRIALAMNIVSSYPVNLSPARSALMDIIKKYFNYKGGDRMLSAITTVCIVAASMATALTVTKLGSMFKVIGGTIGAIVIFALPGIILFSSAKKKYSMSSIGGAMLFCFGVALFVCTIVSYFT